MIGAVSLCMVAPLLRGVQVPKASLGSQVQLHPSNGQHQVHTSWLLPLINVMLSQMFCVVTCVLWKALTKVIQQKAHYF